jgi:hypothetical protein
MPMPAGAILHSRQIAESLIEPGSRVTGNPEVVALNCHFPACRQSPNVVKVYREKAM